MGSSFILDFGTLNISTIAPMMTLCFFALFLLTIAIVKKELSNNFYALTSAMAIILSMGLIFGAKEFRSGFGGLIILDSIALISIVLILLFALFFLFMSFSRLKFHEYSLHEYFVLYLFMLAAYCFMVSSNNIILIFISLETASLALYTLIALHNKKRAIEAAIKYFVMGAVSAGFFAFGAALLYYASGSVDIGDIIFVSSRLGEGEAKIVLLGSIFILLSVGFKISVVPFHTWLADVYEGSSEVMAGFISIVPKIAAFVIAIRLFEPFLLGNFYEFKLLLLVVSLITMTFGNLAALRQVDIKRMLAFSSITHAGYILSVLVIATDVAIASIFVYWVMFGFINVGAFAILWIYADKQNNRFDHPLTKYCGMVKNAPLLALSLAIFMFGLAGIPPFGVFWGKMFLLNTLISSGFNLVALVVVINSAIGAYYYLRVIVFVFLKEPKTEPFIERNGTNALYTIVGLMTAFAILSVFVMKYVTWLFMGV